MQRDCLLNTILSLGSFFIFFCILPLSTNANPLSTAKCHSFLGSKKTLQRHASDWMAHPLEKLGYRFDLSFSQKKALLSSNEVKTLTRRSLRKAMEKIAREDPDWQARRLAMDKLTQDVLFPDIGYHGANPFMDRMYDRRIGLENYISRFGRVSEKWFRGAIELTLFTVDANLGAQILLGRQSAIQWLHKQWLGTKRRAKIVFVAIPSLNYYPLRQRFHYFLRFEKIEQMAIEYRSKLIDYKKANDYPKQIGADFKPPPLSGDQLKGLLWISRNDPDWIVRRQARDLLEHYYREGGMDHLMELTERTFGNSFGAVSEIRKLVEKIEQSSDTDALRPFTMRLEIDEYIDKVSPEPLSFGQLNRVLEEFNDLRTEADQLAFVARVSQFKHTDFIPWETERFVEKTFGLDLGTVSNSRTAPRGELFKDMLDLAPNNQPFMGRIVQFLREIAHYHTNSKVRFAAVVVAKRMKAQGEHELAYSPL